MLELAGFLIGVVTTLAVGLPLAGRLASPDAWTGWTRTAEAAVKAPEKARQIRVFTPLDLGPDPTHWPSERPWPANRFASTEWPSKGWNDEHFGAHWRKAGTAAESTRPAPAASQRPAAEPAPRGEAARAEPKPAPNGRRPLERPTRERGADAEAAPATKGPKAPKAPPAAKAAPTAKAAPAAKAAQGSEPTREELRALLESVGPAETVKLVMARTGWDFRTAAQYVARAR